MKKYNFLEKSEYFSKEGIYYRIGTSIDSFQMIPSSSRFWRECMCNISLFFIVFSPMAGGCSGHVSAYVR